MYNAFAKKKRLIPWNLHKSGSQLCLMKHKWQPAHFVWDRQWTLTRNCWSSTSGKPQLLTVPNPQKTKELAKVPIQHKQEMYIQISKLSLHSGIWEWYSHTENCMQKGRRINSDIVQAHCHCYVMTWRQIVITVHLYMLHRAWNNGRTSDIFRFFVHIAQMSEHSIVCADLMSRHSLEQKLSTVVVYSHN